MSNPDAHVRWIRPHDEAALAEVRQTVAQAGVEVVDAAAAGDAERGLAAASRIKVLCATRHGASGLYRWSADIEADVAALLPEFNRYAAWYVGRPVMVTANDHVTKVNNGDVGLVIRRAGAVEVALPDGSGFRYLSPSRLDRVESWWAMTIHKSQGSEYPHAVLSLPDAGSAILTRELLYTGVTRAREQLTVVASEEALRSAIDRPITRASGLRDRLWPSSA
jgi:exodeoxyribonuclease V alpha subunit